MQQQFNSNVALAANASFTSQWVDNGQDSGQVAVSCQFVRVTSYSDQAGELVIYQADSPTGLTGALVEVARAPAPGGALCKIETVITAEFWQAVYINGPNAQTVCQIYGWSTPNMALALLRELRKINLQLLGLRSPKDSVKSEDYDPV
jgi:hypothetical protein